MRTAGLSIQLGMPVVITSLKSSYVEHLSPRLALAGWEIFLFKGCRPRSARYRAGSGWVSELDWTSLVAAVILHGVSPPEEKRAIGLFFNCLWTRPVVFFELFRLSIVLPIVWLNQSINCFANQLEMMSFIVFVLMYGWSYLFRATHLKHTQS